METRIGDNSIQKTMIHVSTRTFQYQSFRINRSQCLGHGTYGAVYKATCDKLPCAVKIFYPTIINKNNAGSGKLVRKLEQECASMNGIRHPHIVQYLGVTKDTETSLPILLMELVDENLTKLLEHSKRHLPHSFVVDLCHDISLALSYLHSNSIIHHNLTSNNVLVVAGRRVKITDFGMSKLADLCTSINLSSETLAYMSPEALLKQPACTEKVDCFSFGVLAIQICTRLPPRPGPPFREASFKDSPTAEIKVPILETERRKTHIDLIDPKHPLLTTTIQCLNYNEDERPSAQELCQRLATLKETAAYTESVEALKGGATPGLSDVMVARQLRLQRDEANKQIELLKEDIKRKEFELAEKTHENERLKREKEELSGERHEEMKQRDQVITTRDRLLQGSEEVTARYLRMNHELQRQNEELRQQLSQQAVSKLKWRVGGKAPIIMCKGSSVADHDGGTIYFCYRDQTLFSYNTVSKSWETLVKCPHTRGSLAIVKGLLTMIGGVDTSNKKITNLLLSLVTAGPTTKWTEEFPAMPTKRTWCITVSSANHVIVSGGSTTRNFSDNITTVEVLNIETMTWFAAANLPHPLADGSATVCGDRIYILGGHDERGKSKSVFMCSLTELLLGLPKFASNEHLQAKVWRRSADLPIYRCSCVTVSGQVLAIGGCDEDNKSITAVHKYNPMTSSWEVTSHLSVARCQSFVAVLPSNEIMVVGGLVEKRTCTDSVEIALQL